MAGWDEILNEIQETLPQIDYVRRKYLKNLHELTGRNVIAYYSSWLTKQNCENIDINDSDMNGFMNAIRGLDCEKGLDLILHTPGGSPVAAESIVKYLRNKFNNDIRVIVPHLAMSAGTMIACSAKEIVMGKHSSLGPIDPQFNGIPAYNIKKEFDEAKVDLVTHPENAQYWAIQLQKYPPAFIKSAVDAIDLSDELVKEWLGLSMYNKDNPDDLIIINKIANALNQHNDSKEHGRHYDIDFCKQIGLKIVELESDGMLQDALLSVHHTYMLTLSNGPTIKIIENQNGKALVNNLNVN